MFPFGHGTPGILRLKIGGYEPFNSSFGRDAIGGKMSFKKRTWVVSGHILLTMLYPSLMLQNIRRKKRGHMALQSFERLKKRLPWAKNLPLGTVLHNTRHNKS
jgi:hypothetical protein